MSLAHRSAPFRHPHPLAVASRTLLRVLRLFSSSRRSDYELYGAEAYSTAYILQ
jgi:hypothetical protein